jgi:hypothetical protein
MVDIGNGGLRDFHEAAETDFQPFWWKCKKSRETAISTFPGGIFADIKGGRTSGHHDRPVTPSSEVLAQSLSGQCQACHLISLPPTIHKGFADLLRAECVRDGGNGGLTAAWGVCADSRSIFLIGGNPWHQR